MVHVVEQWPPQTMVPPLIGQTATEASDTLRAAALEVGSVSYESAPTPEAT